MFEFIGFKYFWWANSKERFVVEIAIRLDPTIHIHDNDRERYFLQYHVDDVFSFLTSKISVFKKNFHRISTCNQIISFALSVISLTWIWKWATL